MAQIQGLNLWTLWQLGLGVKTLFIGPGSLYIVSISETTRPSELMDASEAIALLFDDSIIVSSRL
jgi:hypothetical protein